MCGRFTLRVSTIDLVKLFDLIRAPELPPRYNIAPTQPVAAIRRQDDGRALDLLHWGLIPSWSKDPGIGGRMINARAESLAEKPSFRTPFRRRRCLIPADGFYEWKRTDGKTKQPMLVTRRDGHPFAFAGLWEHWQRDELSIESCTIITGAPNALLAEFHDRMPVILDPADYDRWLDPRNEDVEDLQSLLAPYSAEEMTAIPVGMLVNSPKHEAPDCVRPLAEA